MSPRALALAAAAALTAGCGASSTSPGAPGDPGTCAPSCATKECGPDGCGGSCGTCAAGASCGAAGTCVAAPPPASLTCPAGQRCFVLERTAWRYACTAPTQCERVDEIGTYPTYEGCRSLGCSGGNSSCGEQFGRDDAVVWECLACVDGCALAEAVPCPLETADGCVYGGETIPCACR